MQSDDVEAARRDMLLWSVPIINDCLVDGYLSRLGANHLSARVIATVHARFWRALLRREREKRDDARQELINVARLAGLDRPAVEDVDQDVLNELLHVVTGRFIRSPHLVQCHTRLLLTASADLAQTCHAAVA